MPITIKELESTNTFQRIWQIETDLAAPQPATWSWELCHAAIPRLGDAHPREEGWRVRAIEATPEPTGKGQVWTVRAFYAPVAQQPAEEQASVVEPPTFWQRCEFWLWVALAFGLAVACLLAMLLRRTP